MVRRVQTTCSPPAELDTFIGCSALCISPAMVHALIGCKVCMSARWVIRDDLSSDGEYKDRLRCAYVVSAKWAHFYIYEKWFGF
jgi:hypothetical protein